MRRCEDAKMRRCFADPHYWKNPALRRSREKEKKRKKGKKRKKRKKIEKQKNMTSRNIFSIENQMQVLPLARDPKEKKEKKKKRKKEQCHCYAISTQPTAMQCSKKS